MMPRDFWEEALPVAEEVESPYPLMFSPLQVGAHRLRNRVVHASMSTYFVRDREVTQRFVDYHASRARGGAAMIVTEPVSIAPWQTADNRLAVYSMDGRLQELCPCTTEHALAEGTIVKGTHGDWQ